jgi:hypothetical protein
VDSVANRVGAIKGVIGNQAAIVMLGMSIGQLRFPRPAFSE